jgi:hypothetical protein
MLYKLLKHVPHEIVMLLHKLLLLLQLLAITVQVLLDLLLAHVLEDTLHVLVTGRSGELGERHHAQLTL